MYWPCSIGVIVAWTWSPKASVHIEMISVLVSTLNGSFVVLNVNSMLSVPSSARHVSISLLRRRRGRTPGSRCPRGSRSSRAGTGRWPAATRPAPRSSAMRSRSMAWASARRQWTLSSGLSAFVPSGSVSGPRRR